MDEKRATFIRVASDLHLESQFGRKMELIEQHFLPKDSRDSESVLVLPGDISSRKEQLFEFISFIEKRFLHVVYVPGNHEFYNHNMKVWIEETAKLFENLTNTSAALSGVMSKNIHGTQFIFGILWGDGGSTPLENMYVEEGLYDFRLISVDNRSFTVEDMKRINREQRLSIESFLSQSYKDKVVVVTHHLPSYELCHPRFGTSINGGFASRCDDLMVGGIPALWIHGHTHDTIDIDLYGTRVVANPHGYKTESNKTHFNSYGLKFIEVDKI